MFALLLDAAAVYGFLIVLPMIAWFIYTVLFQSGGQRVVRIANKNQREHRRAQMWFYRQETKYRRN